MKRVSILLLIAILGIVIAVVMVFNSNRSIPAKRSAAQPSQAPFPSSVFGAGIIEASTGNIAVGAPISGIVMAIYKKVGEHVNAGDPLFKIDDRDLQAKRLTAIAKVREATAFLEKPKHHLEFIENLNRRDKNAVSARELTELRDEVAAAESALAFAKAGVEQTNKEIERCTIRAPVAGQLLQIKTRVGEYTQGGGPETPLMLLGGDSRLHVRADIDENDASRIRPTAKALAFLRGNPGIRIPLRFEYIEPYIVPKTSLTGQSTERTDTRVLQVIYSFDRSSLPVFIGQQVDIFIEAAPVLPRDPAGAR